ncbi:MAG: urate hydroxylase PuuD [Candidatus Omnitrophica bacterium]|nr:urate hydroxylase PuuD [Candidatus Omnitrophota bacterium]
MALQDLYSNLHLLIRWLHVIAGITWIGHLYFFNFVNVPLQGALDDAAKKLVNPKLMPRALWWFRWGAMITFFAGLILFTMTYMYTPGQGFGPSSLFSTPEGITGRAVWILFGMTLGFIMWFNVWMIIWPAQRRMLSGQVPADQLPAVRKKAMLASRINTYLSGPMLFGMMAPSHYGASNLVTIVVASVLGLIAIFWSIKTSFKVGTTV